MPILRFLFREGSPVIFSIVIVLFALQNLMIIAVPENVVGFFAVMVICLIYLSTQMGLTAFSRVGQDGPLVDLFLSLIPIITLIILAVLNIVGNIALSQFQMLVLGTAAIVTMMDIIFNTLVLFKMNRLASDFVQMK